MKRFLLLVLLLFVVVFSGCNRGDDVVVESKRVVLEACQNTTRVSFDGEKSAWEAGDCLSVIVDGLEDVYTFNYDAATESKFVCDNLTMPADQCDVVAYYGVEAASINADKSASVNLGAAEQVQSALSPAAHIAEYDVLYGNAESADRGNIQIAMNHTIAAVKINLASTLAAETAIKSVTITAPENVALAGRYIVNPLTDEIALADNADVINSVNVRFESPVSLGANGYVAWVATAPFALAEGDNLVIDVTTSDDKVYRCTKQIPAEGVAFGAGSIMTTNITLGDNATLVGPELPATVEIVVDPSAEGVMPTNFPTEANKVKSGTFTLAEYDFVFDSPSKFYLSENGRIRFDSGITSTKNAMIKLPVIPNYKLEQVVMASIAKNSTNHNYLFAITDAQKSVIDGGDAYKLGGGNHTYDLTLPAFDTECYICISNTSSSGNTNPANISYISLTYSKIE